MFGKIIPVERKLILICRGIEVVITGLTRNQFVSNHTRVRIPPSAPNKNGDVDTIPVLFFLPRKWLKIRGFRGFIRLKIQPFWSVSKAVFAVFFYGRNTPVLLWLKKVLLRFIAFYCVLLCFIVFYCDPRRDSHLQLHK